MLSWKTQFNLVTSHPPTFVHFKTWLSKSHFIKLISLCVSLAFFSMVTHNLVTTNGQHFSCSLHPLCRCTTARCFRTATSKIERVCNGYHFVSQSSHFQHSLHQVESINPPTRPRTLPLAPFFTWPLLSTVPHRYKCTRRDKLKTYDTYIYPFSKNKKWNNSMLEPS